MVDPLEHYEGKKKIISLNPVEENANKEPINNSLGIPLSSDIPIERPEVVFTSSLGDAAGASSTNRASSSNSTMVARPEPSSSNSSESLMPVQSPSVSDKIAPQPEDTLREMASAVENLLSIAEAHGPVRANARTPASLLPTYDARSAGTTTKESVPSIISDIGEAFNLLDALTNGVAFGTQASSPPSVSSGSNSPQLVDLLTRLGSVFSAFNPSSQSGALGPSSALASSEKGLGLMDVGRKTFTNNPMIIKLTLHHFTSHIQNLTPGEPTYISCQSLVAVLAFHLYELTWDDKYLEEGMNAATLAFMAVDMKDPGIMVKYIPMLSRHWAFGLRLLARKDGDVSKLDSAIRGLNIVWNIYKDVDEELISSYAKGLCRSELGTCLFDRFCATGVLTDLDDAIQHLQALSDERRAVSYLGLAHYERFLQSGNIDDLDKAFFHSRRDFQGADGHFPFPSSKLANTPQDPDEIMGRHLYGLVLAQRFNLSLDIRDLDRAIESCQSALKAMSPSHPMRSYFEADLALIFFSRFEAQEEEEDLRTASDIIRSAVKAFEKTNEGKFGHYTRVPPQAIYGYLLNADGKFGNDRSIVEEGIRYLKNFRKKFSGPPFAESRIEYYLSEAYLTQFNQTKSTTSKAEILESIVHHATLAFEKASENSPYRFHLGLHLGNSLIMSYKVNMDQARLHEAIAHLCSVTWSSTWPSIRLNAGIKWADAADLLGGDGIIDALEVALSILPSLVWAGNHMPTQYRLLLSQRPAVANRAVVHALDAGEVAKAVSYLERGRNILWAQALQLRSSQLTSENRRSEEQKLLSRSLAARSLGGMSPTFQQRMVDVRGRENTARDPAAIDAIDYLKADLIEGFMEASQHNPATRWYELQKSVDEVDEMLPSAGQTLNVNDNDLAKALQAGSIVILNTHRLRCDAIIISEKHGSVDLQHVSLPDISGEEAQRWAECLPRGLYDLESGGLSMPDFEDVFLVPVLQGLWKGIARPVLDHLDLKNDKKRVWWYPTGPLAFLPIHAASPCEGDEPGLPELVVSSYLPSIHSFIRAYRTSKEPLRILAVGQPNTPGHAPLPNVEKEIQMIQRLTKDVPDRLTTIMGEEATIMKVMNSLPEHTALHFACHADQDQSYPSNSAFFLHDGPFHLSRIMNLDLSRVQFAFLSACLTSSGDINLTDECIHLAAGMQFAGVRSAVATIWSVYDTAASTATTFVYRNLFKNGRENAEAQDTAEALHSAILEMKRLNVPLTCRVPFIHVGI